MLEITDFVAANPFGRAALQTANRAEWSSRKGRRCGCDTESTSTGMRQLKSLMPTWAWIVTDNCGRSKDGLSLTKPQRHREAIVQLKDSRRRQNSRLADPCAA